MHYFNFIRNQTIKNSTTNLIYRLYDITFKKNYLEGKFFI